MFDTGLSNRIRIHEIVRPVAKQIARVNSELRSILNSAGLISEGGFFSTLLKNPLRDLRYAMLLLPSRLVGRRDDDNELIRMCAAAELTYSALQLHDGLCNSGSSLEEISAVKEKMDDSSAVLTGDLLYTMALTVIAEIFPKSFLQDLVNSIQKACHMKISDELTGYSHAIYSADSYMESVKKRAAEFTGTFVWLGAYVSKANAEESSMLERCGYNLGMVYQIINDQKSSKNKFENFNPLSLIKEYTEEAKAAVSGFKDSIYRKSLFRLIDYFTEYQPGEGGANA